MKKQFYVTFGADEKQEDFGILFWESTDFFILFTNEKVYFISYEPAIKYSFEVTTPLIGLHIIDDDKILILEETAFKLINSDGQVLKDEFFDLVLNFKLENDTLFITTDEGNSVFLLNS
jgi:hypothetical protein